MSSIENNPIALVIGNGPSVDELDPTVLPHFTTYGCNHIYKKFPDWGRPTDNVVITDSNRIREIGAAYKNYRGNLYIGDERYIRPPINRIRQIIGRDFVPLRRLTKRTMPVNWITQRIRFSRYLYATVFDGSRFSFDLSAGLNFGSSVTISAIQLAVIAGHRRILLTGVDSKYATPKSYFSGMADKIQYVNSSFISNPRIFMEPTLVLLQVYLESLGVELVDCTPGGALTFINKGRIIPEYPYYEVSKRL
jgi:hypothetical protein